MRKIFLFAGLLYWLTLTACAYSISEIARVDAFLAVIEQRLAISDLVAQAKWNSGSAIEDLGRERHVEAQFEAQAIQAGLDPNLAGRVINAQIEASKERQRQRTAEWKAERHPPFSEAPDLALDIRPQLDQLQSLLIARLLEVEPLLARDPKLIAWRAHLLWGHSLTRAQRQALAFGTANERIEDRSKTTRGGP